MKTQTNVEESAVLSEDTTTLVPPVKVTLPTLTHKRNEQSPMSIEGLPNMASRISQIPPTARPRKEVDSPSTRKTRSVQISPGIKPEKRPQPRFYERPSRAFD
jgi:hypothetical protein